MTSFKRNSFFCSFWFFIFWLFSFGVLNLNAEVPSDYYSLHLEPHEIMYKDSADTYQFETRAGFRYVHDYTDPKVLCGSELGPCDAPEKQVALRALKKYIRRFKVYVPPGTSYLQVMLYLPKEGQVATVSRFGQPPTGDYSGMSYAQFPIDDDKGASISELQAADYITRNAAGHTNLISQNLPNVPAGGGWIYVRVLIFDKSEPLENRYTLKVKVPEFQQWYRTVNWDTFDETGGYVQAGHVTDGGYTGDTSGAIPDNPQKPETIFQKLIESGDYGEIPLIEITDYSGAPTTLNLRPKMKLMNAVEGPYNCYAAVIGGPAVFFAERDLIGRVAFIRFLAGDRLRSYQHSAYSKAANTVLECDAFSSDNLMAVDSDFLAQSGLMFLFGVAPESDLGQFQGFIFSFKNVAE